MNQEKANLLNNLIEIEDELQILWDYHPENPDAIHVEDRFTELQRMAASIEHYIKELDDQDGEDSLHEDLF